MAKNYTFDAFFLQNLVLQYILEKLATFDMYYLNIKEVLEN